MIECNKNRKNFFLVLCKTKNKIDKYIKINRIKNKEIINIAKLLEELEMKYEDALVSDLFKIYIHKKINNAINKKKDIYYIPYIDQIINGDKLNEVFNIKETLINYFNFNLLYFYEDFKDNDSQPHEILNQIDKFDLTQILKDY